MTEEDEIAGGFITHGRRKVFVSDETIREQQVKDSASIELIAHKVGRLAQDMTALAAAQTRMAENITALVRIEERQLTATAKIDELAKNSVDKEARLRVLEIALPENAQKRLASIEAKIPTLVESRGWLIGGGLALIGILGAEIAKGVIK